MKENQKLLRSMEMQAAAESPKPQESEPDVRHSLHTEIPAAQDDGSTQPVNSSTVWDNESTQYTDGTSAQSNGSAQCTGSKTWQGGKSPQYAEPKSSVHNRDISSKTVFGNAVLCAQFLQNNFDIPMLKDIRPEDIEDISERYLPYLGTEFSSDSVKKIRILDIGREKRSKEAGVKEPPFFVSLIDHKSLVDYDVSMQLLRYMMCIWTEYRREMETLQKGCTGQKGFRYPVIIPIVYYEGKPEWTAGLHLRDRIGSGSEGQQWIPDFRYELVRVHDYSNQELLGRGDEMSLVMLINKIQDTEDLERFLRIPADKLDRILRDSPEHVVNVLVSVMESLCFKIDASEEERTQCVQKVRRRKMGYLFENMEKISIQEERRKTEEQRKRTEEERKRTEEARKRADEARKRADEEQKRADEEQKRADIAEEKLRILEEKLRTAEELLKQTEH